MEKADAREEILIACAQAMKDIKAGLRAWKSVSEAVKRFSRQLSSPRARLYQTTADLAPARLRRICAFVEAMETLGVQAEMEIADLPVDDGEEEPEW